MACTIGETGGRAPAGAAPTRPYTPLVSEPEGNVAVLIPVKAFRDAKGRLSDVLSPDERAELSRPMAAAVVRAASPLAVWIVCDDDDVAEWATASAPRSCGSPGAA